MLSNENRNAPTAAESAAAFRQDAAFGRQLAQKLVNYDRNPDPRPEAPNPNSGIRIRTWRPAVAITPVDDHCKSHNQAVRDLRKP
jgi:hypothetical protein